MDTSYKALADPTRRQILELLRHEDKTAGDIAAEFHMSWPSVSRHLAVLKHAGLVIAEREGQFIRYSLNTTVIQDIVAELIDLAERRKRKGSRADA
jgi:DNA-binding transcriptional ArsR family regulator